MAGEPVQIGPFIGGLNTFSDPTAVGDNQLVVCENFELDLDGSLMSRPPFVAQPGTLQLGDTGDPQLLGYYFAAGNLPYLIASDGLSKTYFWNGTSWAIVTDTFAASAMTQFDGKAWLLAPATGTAVGGYWTPGGGFVEQPNMPKGDAVVTHKQRLWVVPGKLAPTNSTRLYYSAVLGVPELWPEAPDFIDIGSGDGQSIVSLVVYYSTLILFRTNSIYGLQYTADPSEGTVAIIVPGVGLNDKNCVVPFENYIYFMYDDKAYEFVNNRAAQINVQVPFTSGSRIGIYQPYSVSKFNRRIIYAYWDRTFVFNLRTRTWTTWKSTEHGAIGKLVELDDATEDITAIAFSSKTIPSSPDREAITLQISDSFGTSTEEFECVLQTKNYNYEIGAAYKRLFWWGIEAVFRGEVRGVANPISYTVNGTWGQLLSTTWGALLNQTWGALTFDAYRIETIRDTSGTNAMRKFVKFMKSLRFRQIYFRVSFDSDGSAATSPVRLFLLMTYVNAKQRVSKAVT